MRVIAFSRILYGADFLLDAVSGALGNNRCTDVVLFMAQRPFGGADSVRYFGHEVFFPHRMDDVREAAEECRRHFPGAVHVLDNPVGSVLAGQARVLLSGVAGLFPDATHALMLEPDEVWSPIALDAVFNEAERPGHPIEVAIPVDLYWRSNKFVTTREPTTVLRSLRVPVQDTGFGLSSGMVAAVPVGVRLANLGYAASARSTFWKHLSALSFSRDKGIDSAPREDWFEDWQSWHPRDNPHGRLCPSVGCEGHWKPAQPAANPPRVRHPPSEWASLDA